MIKVTEWYPASVKPVREGWYERRYGIVGIYMQYWNGNIWLHDSFRKRPMWWGLEWRGLAEKPE